MYSNYVYVLTSGGVQHVICYCNTITPPSTEFIS